MPLSCFGHYKKKLNLKKINIRGVKNINLPKMNCSIQ